VYDRVEPQVSDCVQLVNRLQVDVRNRSVVFDLWQEVSQVQPGLMMRAKSPP
jgi:hypothetical protein